jgi:hypothetical protein
MVGNARICSTGNLYPNAPIWARRHGVKPTGQQYPTAAQMLSTWVDVPRFFPVGSSVTADGCFADVPRTATTQGMQFSQEVNSPQILEQLRRGLATVVDNTS